MIFTVTGGAVEPSTVVTFTLSWSFLVNDSTVAGSDKINGIEILLFSNRANASIWLKKSCGFPGIPTPRKNFAKPKILSPETSIFPEVTSANATSPLTTDEVVARGPSYSCASTTFSSKNMAPSSYFSMLSNSFTISFFRVPINDWSTSADANDITPARVSNAIPAARVLDSGLLEL
uniref:Uncharacterized protein n=1 Tax=Opuntia streptacantha TaxID=393608 RepID=A0A7C9E5V8_OPUST